MNTRRTIFAGLAVVCAAAPLPAATLAEGSAANLAPHFEIGATVRYEHALTITQTQRVGKFGTATVSLQMESTLRFTTTRLRPSGGAEVELVFDRLFVDIVRPEKERATYDSASPDQPEDEPFARALAGVAASSVVYELDTAGRVVGLHGAREIGRLIEGLDGFTLVGSVFSEPFFRELIEDVYAPAGESPRRTVGDTWQTTLAIPLGGLPGALTTVVWTLDGVDGDAVRISGAGTTAFDHVESPLLRGLGQRVSGEFSRFMIDWSAADGRTTKIEKARAVEARFSTRAGVLGTVTLGVYTLLTKHGR